MRCGNAFVHVCLCVPVCLSCLGSDVWQPWYRTTSLWYFVLKMLASSSNTWVIGCRSVSITGADKSYTSITEHVCICAHSRMIRLHLKGLLLYLFLLCFASYSPRYACNVRRRDLLVSVTVCAWFYWCRLIHFWLVPSPALVMVIVWRLRGNIIRTAVCWIVWHNVHSQQHTYMSSSYRSNRLGLSHWDPYAVHRGGCLELYYCNMVEWFWWGSSLIFDDQLVSFSALTLLVCWSGLYKSSPKWPIMCWLGR